MPEAKPLNASMQKRFKYTAGATVASGEVLVVAGMICYYDGLRDAASGDIIDLVYGGPIEIAAPSALVLAAGDPVFWDVTDNQVNSDSVNNQFAGTVLRAKSSGQLVARIDLNGFPANWCGYMPNGAPQALSGAGAMNLTTYRTNWTTTGAQAGTLANATIVGHMKKIQFVVDGGDGTLTPATFLEGTTITFADVGDFVVLRWMGSVDGWSIVDIGNDADGVTAPVVA